MYPPGPRSALLATHGMAFDPVGSAFAWGARYGPVVSLPLLSGLTIQIADPELVRKLFQDPGTVFRPGVPKTLDVIIGKRSLINLEGEDHRRERSLMAPCFHAARIEDWAECIADIAARRVGGIGAEGGPEFRALDITQSITLEVILRVVFGIDDIGFAAMHEAVCAMIDATHPSLLFTRLTQRDLLGLSPWRRYRQASEALDRLLYAQVDRVRATLEAGESATSTLASMLVARYDDGSAMSQTQVRDQLRTLLLAGHETSANVLAWSLYFLHRDPTLLARVRAEIETVDPRRPADYFRLPLLGAVVHETLRLRPSVEACFRRLAAPYRLGRWTIPAGATLAPSTLLIHHDPGLYPEPRRFIPERFLGPQPPAHHYFPFGGGTRRCIGATFARFESALVLATALRDAEFELLDDEVEYGRENMTLGPLGGVRMRRLPRRERSSISGSRPRMRL